ncbi:unnamed protein product [Rotaria sordida]|nr:unnamed protein product [Rotaria sordida]
MNQIFEKLLMIYSIDVKMTLTTSSTNGNNKSTSTYHTLCSWSEIPHHPGLIYTMTQMTNNPVILMIIPSIVRLTVSVNRRLKYSLYRSWTSNGIVNVDIQF